MALGSVLFVCTSNRVRSPMAEALARRALGPDVRVESCGLRPSGEVDPLAVAVMAEVGLDIAGRAAAGLTDGAGVFDLVVALSEEAAEALGDRAAAWPTADPTLCEGHRDVRLSAYREVRDVLARRVEDLKAQHPLKSRSAM